MENITWCTSLKNELLNITFKVLIVSFPPINE